MKLEITSDENPALMFNVGDVLGGERIDSIAVESGPTDGAFHATVLTTSKLKPGEKSVVLRARNMDSADVERDPSVAFELLAIVERLIGEP